MAGQRGEGKLARVTGLEPATSGVTGRRSNQLSYTRCGRAPIYALGLRASSEAITDRRSWLVGGDGFEPPTLSV